QKLIIAIDGPAGSGKSTVAKLLAESLGISYLDTGAMYRGIALSALQRNIDLNDKTALTQLASETELEFARVNHDNILLVNGMKELPDGRTISEAIRCREVTQASRYVADNPDIRAMLVEQQKKIGLKCRSLVTEGRDQATVVFPDADFKFYLDARPEVRARRRYDQMVSQGNVSLSYEQILSDQLKRDYADQNRDTGALRIADDAIVVDTSEMVISQVVSHLLSVINTTK
ncbi:MAG: (d)CMP kinase, partial [Sedimentisphaerales bacterium]|nr:(d)CMP kinase [Sedimentisphaerales bacterium]